MYDERLQTIRPLVAIFVLLAVVAALKTTATVTMPVALAIFTVILAWPLQRLLERKRIPRTLAYCITLGAILSIFACFIFVYKVSPPRPPSTKISLRRFMKRPGSGSDIAGLNLE